MVKPIFFAAATADPHPAMILPFALMLLCIALMGSLFVVAGGIHIEIKGGAKPWANCLFLFIGAVLANVIGTTGASMLLIRPWMRLFAGIFATMVTALDYLEIHAAELGLDSEMKFSWLTGLLSGALDNAPTYLTFLAAAMGLHDLSLNDPEHLRQLVATHDQELMAISLGAVFFGAMTYIGNGPNFMVKSIAEQAGVKTPSFFAYLLKYALPILIPLLAVISLLFFSRWRVF